MSSINTDTHLLIFNVTLSVLFYLYDLKFCNQNLNHVMFTEQFCSSTKSALRDCSMKQKASLLLHGLSFLFN